MLACCRIAVLAVTVRRITSIAVPTSRKGWESVG
jgi:hypothetical protein